MHRFWIFFEKFRIFLHIFIQIGNGSRKKTNSCETVQCSGIKVLKKAPKIKNIFHGSFAFIEDRGSSKIYPRKNISPGEPKFENFSKSFFCAYFAHIFAHICAYLRIFCAYFGSGPSAYFPHPCTHLKPITKDVLFSESLKLILVHCTQVPWNLAHCANISTTFVKKFGHWHVVF